MNKKILIVSECFYPEEFKVNNIAFDWQEKGFQVDILTLAPTYPLGKIFSDYKNKIFHKYEHNGLNIFRLRAVTGYKESFFKKILRFINFMILGSFAALFIGKKYDYIFGFNTGALTSMLPAVLINKIYKKPLMLWVQDIWPDSLYAYGLNKNIVSKFILNHFVKFMHSDINSVAVSCNGFKDRLKPYLKKNTKIEYLPNWPDELISSNQKISMSEEKKVHFTFAGNIGKQQNLENILEAFSQVPNNIREKSQLNIIGDGPRLLNLKKIAKDNKNIVFYGRKPSTMMSAYYEQSDFLIVSLVDKPAFSITVPSKTQTYIAAKKPILAIIKGETSQMINELGLGLSAHPSNKREITNLFITCLSMKESEKKLFIKENERLLKTTFNKEKIVNRLLANLLECKR